MTRQLIIMAGVASVAGTAGLATLVKPALARRVLGIADSEPAAYGLRIAGMMLFALGLFLGGFAVMFIAAGGLG